MPRKLIVLSAVALVFAMSASEATARCAAGPNHAGCAGPNGAVVAGPRGVHSAATSNYGHTVTTSHGNSVTKVGHTGCGWVNGQRVCR
jgi:hypothetical protein